MQETFPRYELLCTITSTSKRKNRLKRLEVAYVAEIYQGDKLSFYREEIAPLEYAMKVVKIKKETQETIEVCRILMNFVKD